MKTVAINGRFLGQPKTGVQRYAYEILSALGATKQEKYRFVCVVPGNQGYKIPEGIEVFEDESFPCSGPVWRQFRLPFAASRLKADILWSPCNISPLLSAQKQLVTVFDASVYAGPEWFNWKFRFYYRIVLSFYRYTAARIITCSEFSKEEISRYLRVPKQNIDVAYGAIAPDFKRTSGVGPVKGRYVLSLGSRDPRKNVPALIDCWRTLPAGIKSGRRLVVAGGNQPTFFREKLGSIPEDVVFTGYLDDSVLPLLYSNADCLIYPSLYEGFGLPPLEAMSCGCPVITSNRASLPEVCGDAALYVDPKLSTSISSALTTLLCDASVSEGLIAKGYENVRRFSWGSSAAAVLKALDKLEAQ